MKTYTKIHTEKKALETHIQRIKRRGGVVKTVAVKGGTQIDYYFPEKATPKIRSKKKRK